MAGLMNYLNDMESDSSSKKSSTKAPYMPASSDEVLMNALQKLSESQGAGDLGQGLAGFAYAMQAGQRGAQQQQQQQSKQQALASVFDKLSQGNPSAAIGAFGDAARKGLSAEDIARFNEILKSGTQIQTSRDAKGNPVFVSAANAIGQNLPDAPQQNTEFKTQADVINNQMERQQRQQGLGIENARLGLDKDKFNFDQAQKNYGSNSPTGRAYTNAFTQDLKDTQKSAEVAQNNMQSLQELEALIKQYPTGPGATKSSDTNTLLNTWTLGAVPLSDQTKGFQRIDALTNQLTLNANSSLKGATSDKDIAFLKATQANKDKDPTANQKIIDFMRKANERFIYKNQFYNDMAEQGATPIAIKKAWSDYVNKNPLSPSEDIKPSSNIPSGMNFNTQQQPPIQGARKAPDGNFYAPDPNRPGKYVRVEQ